MVQLTTAPPVTPRSYSEQDAIIASARIAAATQSFADFLQYVKTEEGPFPFWPFQNDPISCLTNNQSFVWLKRRQIMASWLIAAACVWMAGLHRNSHVGVISKDEKEAFELMRKMKVILLNMPRWFHIPFKGSEPMRFPASGSEITPFSATAVGGVGRSLKLAVFDEFALHEYGGDNLTLVTPAVTNSDGMMIVCSTSDPLMGEAGSFYDLWTRSEAGETDFNPIFSDRFCRPDQGSAWWDKEKLRFPTERVARALYPLTPEEAFTSESGLVFGEDDDGRLIFDRERNLQLPPVKWGECLWRVVGIDPGGSDPTGIVAVGLSKADKSLHLFDDRYHVYASKRWKGAPSAQDLRTWLLELETAGHIDAIFCDPSQGALVETLNRMGLPAYSAPNDRRGGIPFIQGLFKSGQLTIHPEDKVIVGEIMTYKKAAPKGEWRRGGGGVWEVLTPKWHHGDLIDALRYAIYGLFMNYPGMSGGESFIRPVRASAYGSRLSGNSRYKRLSAR